MQRRLPPPRTSPTPPPQVARQQENKPLWKRMSDGVSNGFKRLWPFKKKPATDQTATLPPAQLGPSPAQAAGGQSQLPRLEPPMPVQEAKVPWYKKLFRR